MKYGTLSFEPSRPEICLIPLSMVARMKSIKFIDEGGICKGLNLLIAFGPLYN